MGKSSIVYVMGLSCLIAISLRNISDSSTSSMDAYTNYYARTMAHNVAAAGANIAVGRLFRGDTTFTGGTFAIGGGTVTYSYQVLDADPTYGIDSVSVTATSVLNVETGIGSDKGAKRDTVSVFMNRPGFNRFGWWTNQEVNGYKDTNGVAGPFSGAADWKITGDSVWGPAHTNGHFNLGGTPYFFDKVTGGGPPNITKFKPTDKPVFENGNQWGVHQDRPKSNIDKLKSGAESEGVLFKDQDVELTFKSDSVRVRIPPAGGGTMDTTVLTTALVKNPSAGIVIAVQNGDMRIKGTYKGNITLAAFSNSTGKKGNVWLDGDVVAYDDPRTNPASNDMLGIVAERFVYIPYDPSRTSSSVLTVEASIYTQNGELTAYDFWKPGLQGTFKLFGGVIQNTAGSLGTFNSGGILTGFNYNIRYDERFRTRSTWMFPPTNWAIALWWEN